MPQHKVTFFFTSAINVANPALVSTVGALGGWTETFYDPRDLTDAVALQSSFAALRYRLALLTLGWRCYLIRVSRFPLTRTAAKMAVTPADGQGKYTIFAGASSDMQAYTVLIVNFSSTAGRPRAWGMRGVGYDVVGANGLYLAPPTFVGVFGQFASVWAGTNPYAMKISTNAAPQLVSGVLTAPTALLPSAAPATPAIQHAGPVLAGPPFPSLRISGCQGIAGLNGVWQVASSTSIAGVTTTQLLPKRNALTTGAYTQGGKVVAQTTSLDNFVTATPGQGGAHKLGRAPFAPRGRRSRRRQ